MVGTRPPPVSAERPDVRAQILASATRLFATHGFDATPIQAVADDVGIAKQSLLHHFPSKEHLRKSVLGQMLAHWRETLPRLLIAATAASDRWDAVTGELVGFFTDDPNRARLLLREALDRPDETRVLLAEYVRPFLEAVSTYIRKGQAHGEHVPTADPEAYVMAIIQIVVAGVAVAPAFSSLLDAPPPGPLARYRRELLRMARESLFVSVPAGSTSAHAAPAPRESRKTSKPAAKGAARRKRA